MKTSLRVALMLLCSVMLLVCFHSVSYAESGTWGNLTWTLDANGVLTISGEGEMEDFGGYSAWDRYAEDIRTVVIGEKVTSIGGYAFHSCVNLINITIPESVTRIGEHSLQCCSSLTSINIPKSVINIEEFAFCECSSLKRIAVDPANPHFCDRDGVLFDKSGTHLVAFPEGYSNSYTIPSDVTNIDFGAFARCRSLTSVVMQAGLKTIGEYAFFECVNLKGAEIPESVTKIGSRAFTYCHALTDITIPSNVRSIDGEAFYGCENLKSVDISSSLKSIGDSAFYCCDKLTDIYYHGTEEQYEQIEIGTLNEPFQNALKHYVSPQHTYTVTYDANGGSFFSPQEAETKIEGETLTLSTNTPFMLLAGTAYGVSLDANGGSVNPDSLTASITSNASFRNWNTKVDGSGTSYAPGADYTADEDATLYAQWDIITTNHPVTLPTPVREGYLFKGWSENRNADSGYTGEYMPSEAVVLYAIWEPQSIAEGTWGELEWKLGTDGALVISGKGDMADFDSESADAWLSYTESIHTVEISEGVSSIGEYAFRRCLNMKQVNIPQSVKVIGKGAFNSCTGLTAAVIPAGVSDISSTAFTDCSSLTAFAVDENNPQYCDIDGVLFNKQGNTLLCCPGGKSGRYAISENVTGIGEYAFSGCSGLTNVMIPAGVTSIGKYAFVGCVGLQSVTIPGNGANIGTAAFLGCNNLTSATLGDGVEEIGSMAFANCSSLESITIPGNVTSIGSQAFIDCTGLTRAKIQNGVTSIGFYAFYGCSNLTEVTIPPSVTSIGTYAFYNCSGLNAVYINDLAAWCAIPFREMSYSNPLQYAQNLYLNGTLVVDMVIPAGVASIGANTFADCNSLISVTIPGTVKNIDKYAFANCSSLTDVIISEGVTSIGPSAFYNCRSLKNVVIPSGMTGIGSNAFYACVNLTSITIPASMTNIENGAFTFSGLANLTLQEGLASIGEYAFSCCPALTSVTIPGSVKNIDRGAFSRCNHMSNVTIMEGVTSIGEYAFDGCIEVCDGDGLKSLILPKSVISIKENAFRDCEFLTNIFYVGSQEEWNNITIGDNNTPLLSAAKHYNTVRITPDLTLPASLTTIESEAFAGGGFASVLIPPTVKTIAPDAFGDRTDLIILGTSGSYAETFAGEKHFTFVPAA